MSRPAGLFAIRFFAAIPTVYESGANTNSGTTTSHLSH